MGTGRLEAFSDGVLAIIITIMVLELKVPHEATTLASLRPLLPVFLSYILSFIYLGIYWNNHHHLFQAVHHVNGAALWANLHLLFWLSLIPFVTGWVDRDTAVAELERAHELAPDDLLTRVYLAEALLDLRTVAVAEDTVGRHAAVHFREVCPFRRGSAGPGNSRLRVDDDVAAEAFADGVSGKNHWRRIQDTGCRGQGDKPTSR